jgi:dTMP kinase
VTPPHQIGPGTTPDAAPRTETDPGTRPDAAPRTETDPGTPPDAAPRTGGTGSFIVLEGPDGAGKSVQAPRLAAHLRARGFDVTLTREPGGTPLGEQVRAVLLDPGPVARGPVADALLFNAARSQLVPEVIRPALARGSIVVSDRYATSTMAYQGYGSGVDRDVLRGIERLVTGGLEPDLVVLIDVPVDVGLARREAGSTSERTRFEDSERHDRAFHERVRDGYLAMAAAGPDRWVTVTGDAPPDLVAASVARAVDDLPPRAGVHGA